jgi:hypothetical protein
VPYYCRFTQSILISVKSRRGHAGPDGPWVRGAHRAHALECLLCSYRGGRAGGARAAPARASDKVWKRNDLLLNDVSINV